MNATAGILVKILNPIMIPEADTSKGTLSVLLITFTCHANKIEDNRKVNWKFSKNVILVIKVYGKIAKKTDEIKATICLYLISLILN